MKKVIILSLMIVSAFSVDAQRKRTRTATSQGNVVVRFDLGINSSKWDRDANPANPNPLEMTSTEIKFGPSVGYMVIDNLELGVNFGITNTNSEDIYNLNPTLIKDKTKSTDVNFGVYIQKYMPLNNWFAFTGGGDLHLSTGTYQTDAINAGVTTPVVSGNTNGVGGEVNFGLMFTPYNAFGLEAKIARLSVNNRTVDPDNVNNTERKTDVDFNLWNQTPTIGFVWYFGRGLWKK